MPALEYALCAPGSKIGGPRSAASSWASVGGVVLQYGALPSPSDGMPAVWVTRCRSVIRRSICGTQRATGSSRSSFLASRSWSSAIPVTSLVSEPIR